MLKKIQDAMRDRHIPNMSRLSLISEPTLRKILAGKKVREASLKRAALYLNIKWEDEDDQNG